MKFSNDPDKAQKNLSKHDVPFDEGETVFADPLALTFFDVLHSNDEDRWLTFGVSSAERYLVVWHTEADNEVHLIGVREMDKKERKQYEQYKR